MNILCIHIMQILLTFHGQYCIAANVTLGLSVAQAVQDRQQQHHTSPYTPSMYMLLSNETLILVCALLLTRVNTQTFYKTKTSSWTVCKNVQVVLQSSVWTNKTTTDFVNQGWHEARIENCPWKISQDKTTCYNYTAEEMRCPNGAGFSCARETREKIYPKWCWKDNRLTRRK